MGTSVEAKRINGKEAFVFAALNLLHIADSNHNSQHRIGVDDIPLRRLQ